MACVHEDKKKGRIPVWELSRKHKTRFNTHGTSKGTNYLYYLRCTSCGKRLSVVSTSLHNLILGILKNKLGHYRLKNLTLINNLDKFKNRQRVVGKVERVMNKIR